MSLFLGKDHVDELGNVYHPLTAGVALEHHLAHVLVYVLGLLPMGNRHQSCQLESAYVSVAISVKELEDVHEFVDDSLLIHFSRHHKQKLPKVYSAATVFIHQGDQNV